MDQSSQAKMICVVDDDDAVRAMMVRKLTDAGFATVEATNGIEAIEVLKTTRADVAIVDIIMPDQEGLSTIGQIKQMWPHMRILAVSGGGRGSAEDYLTFASELGADDVLPKPFREDAFLDRVRKLARPS
jgi:DNA-binding response OmpR family regulator